MNYKLIIDSLPEKRIVLLKSQNDMTYSWSNVLCFNKICNWIRENMVEVEFVLMYSDKFDALVFKNDEDFMAFKLRWM